MKQFEYSTGAIVRNSITRHAMLPHYVVSSIYYGTMSCEGIPSKKHGNRVDVGSEVCQQIRPRTVEYNSLLPRIPIFSFKQSLQLVDATDLNFIETIYNSTTCTGEVIFQSSNLITDELNQCHEDPISKASYTINWVPKPEFNTGFLNQ